MIDKIDNQQLEKLYDIINYLGIDKNLLLKLSNLSSLSEMDTRQYNLWLAVLTKLGDN